MRDQDECFSDYGKQEIRFQAFLTCSTELYMAEKQAGSVKWESLTELCEGPGGSMVGQESHWLCVVESSRWMAEKGGSAKDLGRVVRMDRLKMGEQKMK